MRFSHPRALFTDLLEDIRLAKELLEPAVVVFNECIGQEEIEAGISGVYHLATGNAFSTI
jgi:hypothetical protein